MASRLAKLQIAHQQKSLPLQRLRLSNRGGPGLAQTSPNASCRGLARWLSVVKVGHRVTMNLIVFWFGT